MKNDYHHKKTGFVKIFLSSTFNNLKSFRKSVLKKLDESLEAAGMEKFIPTGETSQRIIFRELNDSDAIIFLITSNYGSRMKECQIKGLCPADCFMKDQKRSFNISYTWCEYRLSENKIHVCYLIRDKIWNQITKKHSIGKFKEEINTKEEFIRIEDNEIGLKRILNDLAYNLIFWYKNQKIQFNNFCGRKENIEKLFTSIQQGGSIEVSGLGGIGKTTLCEIVLLLFKLLNKQIYYLGLHESYSSGTGYEYASGKFNIKRTNSIGIFEIISLLGLNPENKQLSTKQQVNLIIKFLDLNEGSILYIDNMVINSDISELVKKGNSLKKGAILYTTKRELRLASKRIHLEALKDETEDLVRITLNRLDRKEKFSKKEMQKLSRLIEGHPIAAYIIISNFNRLDLEQIVEIADVFDLSDENDLLEYLTRIIKLSINNNSFNLLIALSLIDEKIDFDMIINAYQNMNTKLSTKEIQNQFLELLDAHLMLIEENKLIWSFNHIREILLNKSDVSKNHILAHAYYKLKEEKFDNLNDTIMKLYHHCKKGFSYPLIELFLQISETILEESDTDLLSNMIKLGQALREKGSDRDKAFLSYFIGHFLSIIARNRYNPDFHREAIQEYTTSISYFERLEEQDYLFRLMCDIGDSYRYLGELENITENCEIGSTYLKKAINYFYKKKAYYLCSNALNILGTIYQTLAFEKDSLHNFRKSIRVFDAALKIFNASEPIDLVELAMIYNNRGITFSKLSQIVDDPNLLEEAISSFKEALAFYNENTKYQENRDMTLNNLGNAYRIKAEKSKKIEDIVVTLDFYFKSLETRKSNDFQYAQTLTNLGAAFVTLAKFDEIKYRKIICQISIYYLDKALEMYTLEEYPMQHAMSLENLAYANEILTYLNPNPTSIQRTENLFQILLNFYHPDIYFQNHTKILRKLGFFYATLAVYYKMKEYCSKAIDILRKVKEDFKIFNKTQSKKVGMDLEDIIESCKNSQ